MVFRPSLLPVLGARILRPPTSVVAGTRAYRALDLQHAPARVRDLTRDRRVRVCADGGPPAAALGRDAADLTRGGAGDGGWVEAHNRADLRTRVCAPIVRGRSAGVTSLLPRITALRRQLLERATKRAITREDYDCLALALGEGAPPATPGSGPTEGRHDA